MNRFESALHAELESIRTQGLYRSLLPIDAPQQPRVCALGRELVNFSSNDYLGLANHEMVKAAAIRAIERYGAGSGASRLISGSLALHGELEETLAAFKRREAALSFSSGYAAALGTIGALLGSDDVIVLDRLVHACVIDAARLSGAKLRVFAHNDVEDLERKLAWAATRLSSHSRHDRTPRVLVVTESVFSMDGDHAPLRDIVALKERFGAWLMVDEAHATGVLGPGGRGLAEAQGVADQIEVHMGTLGKAIGSAGGFIAGSRSLIDLLINRARSFIFSTAPTPAAGAAATAGVRLAESEEGDQRRALLCDRVEQLQAGLVKLPRHPDERTRNPGTASDVPPLSKKGAIVPWLVGAEDQAMTLAACLRERGFLVPAIRYPTVARGKARLRLTLSTSHRADEVAALLDALKAAVVLGFSAVQHAPSRPA